MAETVTSTPVADDELIVADDYNKLRADIIDADGHAHDDYGGQVDHKNLLETGLMTSRKTTHANIDTHIVGGGASFTDDPGGDQGVHGLPDIAYVLGSIGDDDVSPKQGVIQFGTATTNIRQQIGSSSYWEQTMSSPVSFPKTFDAVPVVFIVPWDTESARVAADVTTSGFTPYIGFAVTPKKDLQYSCTFMWIAIEEVS